MDFLNFVHMPFGYLLPFIAALTIIVFIHELGHFLVARWCGVAVEVFSIGFGREIFGWNDRHGTRWKVCWLPLGGYVKFEGDANPTSLPQASPEAGTIRTAGNFHGKPVWKRAAVVAAGPIANFLLSIVIFASVFAFVGMPMNEPRVGTVQPGSAAEKAGITSGDLIAAIDGVKIETFGDIVKSVSFRGGELLNVTIDRNGTPIVLNIVVGTVEEPDGFGGTSRRGLLGISPPKETVATPLRRLSITDAVSQGTSETWRIVSVTFKYLGKLVRGQENSKQIGGPVSIAKMAGDAASSGVIRFAIFIAFLSTSVGLINLFPIPMLDGGHLVYYAIETVSGKPLGKQAQEWGFRVGLSLVAMLMAFGFWNDLTRVFAMMVGG
ncbi:MAG TPA: RIP metalloprotease RseP [Aestuariivirga sp.]|jgi:regulator of sigma E protease|nr:RIP metalloprotease RseP [Hyphomicrobiales bacterium]HQY72352.1 RIP metalloprotease RseP [Aestuariivirga sp.]